MKPQVSVLIAHLRETENDKALKMCLECLVDNTSVDYEIIVSAVEARRDLYTVCNEMATRAQADYIVFHNSDVFMAPGWAEPMLAAARPDRIVAGVIVECGAIGVAIDNIHKNFGMRPDTFRRAEFERWVREVGHVHVPPTEGWYFPSLHPRETFLEMGGFDLTKGAFPTDPLDIIYWDTWRKSGRKVKRVASFCYHLQHYSDKSEQEKEVRHR